MNLENLEKASQLRLKLNFIEQSIEDAKECVISIGSARMDAYGDIQEKLCVAIVKELIEVKNGVLEEIRNL